MVAGADMSVAAWANFSQQVVTCFAGAGADDLQSHGKFDTAVNAADQARRPSSRDSSLWMKASWLAMKAPCLVMKSSRLVMKAVYSVRARLASNMPIPQRMSPR